MQPRCMLLGSVLVATTACTDYSVHVSFDIPSEYSEHVDSIQLLVLVPPPAEPFTCEDVAFRRVSPDTIALSTVHEASPDEPDLDDIPRTGTKLFYAQGLDDQSLPIVADCEPYDEITGPVNIDLVGEPTSVVTVQAMPGDSGLPSTAVVRTADINGELLGNVDIEWTVTGPASFTSGDMATTNANGAVDIQIVAPTAPGPVALDVHARWERVAYETIRGFTAPDEWLADALPGTAGDRNNLGPTESLYVVGRIGPSGEPGFAALGPSTDPFTTGSQIYVAYYDDTLDPPFRRATTTAITGAFTLGMITKGGRDVPFVITGTSWIEVQPNGSIATFASPKPGRVVSRIVPAGPCDASGDIDQVLVAFNVPTTTNQSEFVTYNVNRAAVNGALDDQPMTSRVVAGGCAADVAGDPHPTAVFSDADSRQTVVADMQPTREVGIPAVGVGIGFSRPLASEAPRLLATEIEIDGTNLNRYRLSPFGNNMLDAEIVTSDATPTLSISIQGGDVDGDGNLDIVSLLNFGEFQRVTRYRVFAALAVPHLDGRLVGLSAEQEADQPRIWLMDFDGDSVDDILIGSPTSFTVYRL